MSQKNQGNTASKRQGANSGKPGNTKTVAGIEKVGGKGSGTHSFSVPNHPEHCDVDTPQHKDKY
jgi:hypothetical protein